MNNYIFELCKTDGSTPLGQCPAYEVSAADSYAARAKVLQEHPGHEVVSWGARTDIEDYRRRYHLPPLSAEPYNGQMLPEGV